MTWPPDEVVQEAANAVDHPDPEWRLAEAKSILSIPSLRRLAELDRYDVGYADGENSAQVDAEQRVKELEQECVDSQGRIRELTRLVEQLYESRDGHKQRADTYREIAQRAVDFLLATPPPVDGFAWKHMRDKVLSAFDALEKDQG